MPAGAPSAPGRVPGGAACFIFRLGRLPQRKILRVLFRIVVLDHARASPYLASVETRELSVILELVDREIDAPVVGKVGELALDESLNDRDHLRNVVRRLRVELGVLNPQEEAIIVKDCRDQCSYFSDRDAALARRLDDFVVDVGQVHYLKDFPAAKRNYAPE